MAKPQSRAVNLRDYEVRAHDGKRHPWDASPWAWAVRLRKEESK